MHSMQTYLFLFLYGCFIHTTSAMETPHPLQALAHIKGDIRNDVAIDLSQTLFQHFGIPSNTVSDIQKLLVAHIVGPGGWYYKHATCTHTGELSVFDINAQGTLLATTCADDKANVWRMDTGTLSRVYEHTAKVNNAMFGPDGRTLLTSSLDNHARIWSLEGTNGKPQIWGNNVDDIAVTPTKNNKQLIATILSDDANSVCIYDANRNFITWFSHGNYLVYDILFHAQGEVVATKAPNNMISLWSLKERKKLWQKELGVIDKIIFHEKKNVLAVAYLEKNIELFDFKGISLDVIEKTDDIFIDFDFHPTKCILATACDDNMVDLWQYKGDFKERSLLYRLEQTALVHDLTFNLQGTILAIATYQGKVCLWNMDGVLLRVLPHDAPVWASQFSPAENVLVTAANDNAMHIWHKHEKPTLKQVLLRLVLYQYYRDCDKKNEKPEICATHDLIPEWMAQKFVLKKDELLNTWHTMPESLRKSIFNTLVFRAKNIEANNNAAFRAKFVETCSKALNKVTDCTIC